MGWPLEGLGRGELARQDEGDGVFRRVAGFADAGVSGRDDAQGYRTASVAGTDPARPGDLPAGEHQRDPRADRERDSPAEDSA